MMKLFSLTLMLLVAGVAFFGYTSPAYTKAQGLQLQVTELDRILAEASEFQRLKTQLLARYNALPSEQLARLTKLLPDHVDNVRLILDVDSLAAANGLSLENVIINVADSGASENAGAGSGALGAMSAQNVPYDSLTLQFRTEGSYEDFVQFLGETESSLRLVDVVELSMHSSPTSEADEYTFDVKVRTYWLK